MNKFFARKVFALAFTVLLFVSASFSQEKRPVRVNNDDDVADLMQDAKDGDRGAQFELSMVYMYKQDAQNQLKWLTASAENGFGKAQYILGNLYYNGTSKISKDYEKAVHWFNASKESGFNGANVDEKIIDSRRQIELAKKRALDQMTAAKAQAAAAEAKKKKEQQAKERAKIAARAATEEIIFAKIISQKAATLVSKIATEKIVSSKIMRAPEKPEQKTERGLSKPSLLKKFIIKAKLLIKEIL
jgi:TPR repeat protein